MINMQLQGERLWVIANAFSAKMIFFANMASDFKEYAWYNKIARTANILKIADSA
jgi:hypothetical protein